MRSRHITGISPVDEMLVDPPRLVTGAGIELCNPIRRFLRPIMFDVDRRNILSEPSQKFGVNFRADILPGWILARHGEFLFEFQAAVWIEFEKQTSGIFQGELICTGERIILAAKRVDAADEIKRGLGVGHAPDTTFREPLSRANRECKQKR